MSDMKLCKDCRFFKPQPTWGQIQMAAAQQAGVGIISMPPQAMQQEVCAPPVCSSERAAREPVYGRPIKTCIELRGSKLEGCCGMEAKWFEAKP